MAAALLHRAAIKISLMFAQYFEYYAIGGRFFCGHTVVYRIVPYRIVLSLYIKRGKTSVRNVRTYVRNGGRGQLSSE